MHKQNVIAIFDIGKTNKKLFLFDENYQIVYDKTTIISEIEDEDGFPCEDLQSLRSFIDYSFREILANDQFDVKSLNFSAYGASFVLVGSDGEPVAPLYNYLKPYPKSLLKQFYQTYGGEDEFSRRTASPVLGSLNSGMQVYRIKYEKPKLFQKIRYAFHLPQYLSYTICNGRCSDLTSVGCHTNLWDFQKHSYHEWVAREEVLEKLLPIVPTNQIIPSLYAEHRFSAGIGLHDSSAALIPYLLNFQHPFVLISTGTWCISLNPFNQSPLTPEELKQDCLCYLQYNGKPVKAARLFAGHTHDEQVRRIADHFHTHTEKYKQLRFEDEIGAQLERHSEPVSLIECAFEQTDLSRFSSDVQAYHQLISDLIAQQQASTRLVTTRETTKQIFVDGGFSKNEIYMNLLAAAFPRINVYAASLAQATSLGTALAIHKSWNKQAVPSNLIPLKSYSSKL